MAQPVEVFASGLFGLLAGVLSGFLGIGGGAIVSPLLVVTLGMTQQTAQGISLAALLPPVGLPAVVAYRRSGVAIAWSLVALLVVGFGLGGVLGAWFAHRIPQRELRWLFAAFLATSALRAALGRSEGDDDAPRSRPTSVFYGFPIGLVAGVLSGILGVGGGLIVQPLLRKMCGLGSLESKATTLAMMLPPIGLPAVYVYAKAQGGLPWDLMAVVGVGFALGAAVGARGAVRTKPRASAIVTAVLLGGLAVMILMRSC